MELWTDVDWGDIASVLIHLGVAYALALPVAWDREIHARSAGLRTFPLVASATCGYMLVARALFGEGTEAQARVLEGLVAGVGFIGGGAILRTRGTVQGTATAAALWSTGAIGVAVAADRFEIALALGITTFLTFLVFARLKHQLGQEDRDKRPDDPL